MEMNQNPAFWRWPEWVLVISVSLLFIVLAFESISHFGRKLGLLRVLIFSVLMAVFFVAGFFAGLFITAILAIGMLVYFIRYWQKLMVIK